MRQVLPSRAGFAVVNWAFSLRSLYFSLLNTLSLTVPCGFQCSSKTHTTNNYWEDFVCTNLCVRVFQNLPKLGLTVEGGWIRVPWVAEYKEQIQIWEGKWRTAVCHRREGAADWKELPQLRERRGKKIPPNLRLKGALRPPIPCRFCF